MNDMKDQSRNLNPTPEAVLAMHMWGYEYAHKQKGGSMDFWDGLGKYRQTIVRDCLQRIDAAKAKHSRG